MFRYERFYSFPTEAAFINTGVSMSDGNNELAFNIPSGSISICYRLLALKVFLVLHFQTSH